jgi:hypothetical protein
LGGGCLGSPEQWWHNAAHDPSSECAADQNNPGALYGTSGIASMPLNAGAGAEKVSTSLENSSKKTLFITNGLFPLGCAGARK